MRRRSHAERRTDPAAVSDAIRRLVGRKGWSGNLALGRLRERWSDVVGAQVAARSEPVRLAAGRLTIRAESGAWAAELALLAPSLTEAVGRFIGPDHVREVSVVAGTPRGRTDPFGAPSDAGSAGPRKMAGRWARRTVAKPPSDDAEKGL